MTVFMFPGQGSQKVGMGAGLFEEFAEITAKADQVLGYSIAEVCLQDTQTNLVKTQFTQPALYVVNALTYLKKRQDGAAKPSFVIGHSLGEYSALFAAEAFDFETGLRLVKKRGELMAKAPPGGMAAVIGMTSEKVQELLKEPSLSTLDVANHNSFSQVVIAGPKDDVLAAKGAFEAAGCRMYIPLNVGGAFHSRYMAPSRDEFRGFIDGVSLKTPTIPVIANLTAQPYSGAALKQNLVDQICHSVLWTQTIQFLLESGESEFVEIGPGNVLAGLVAKIRRNQ